MRVAQLRAKVADLTPSDSGSQPVLHVEGKEDEEGGEDAKEPEPQADSVSQPTMDEGQAALHIQRVARGGVARKKAARQAQARRQRELEAARRERMLEEGLS